MSARPTGRISCAQHEDTRSFSLTRTGPASTTPLRTQRWPSCSATVMWWPSMTSTPRASIRSSPQTRSRKARACRLRCAPLSRDSLRRRHHHRSSQLVGTAAGNSQGLGGPGAAPRRRLPLPRGRRRRGRAGWLAEGGDGNHLQHLKHAGGAKRPPSSAIRWTICGRHASSSSAASRRSIGTCSGSWLPAARRSVAPGCCRRGSAWPAFSPLLGRAHRNRQSLHRSLHIEHPRRITARRGIRTFAATPSPLTSCRRSSRRPSSRPRPRIGSPGASLSSRAISAPRWCNSCGRGLQAARRRGWAPAAQRGRRPSWSKRL